MRTKRVSYSAVQSVEEPRDTTKKVDVTTFLGIISNVYGFRCKLSQFRYESEMTRAPYCTECVRLGKYMYPACEPPHRLSTYSFLRAVEEAKVGRRHSQHT